MQVGCGPLVTCRVAQGCGAWVGLCARMVRVGAMWCCPCCKPFACCGAVLPAVLVLLHVCGLCTVLLMAHQGTHPTVLNRVPGGWRHLCAGFPCMCVAGVQ